MTTFFTDNPDTMELYVIGVRDMEAGIKRGAGLSMSCALSEDLFFYKTADTNRAFCMQCDEKTCRHECHKVVA